MAQNKESSSFDIIRWYREAEQFFEDNQQLVTTILVAIVVVVGGYFGYLKFYKQPRAQQAHEQIFRAQHYFKQDSLNLAIRGDGNYPGFEGIIDEYSGTPAANLSKYYLGISYLRMGDYQKAQTYLKQFEADDVFLSVISKGALGDVYAQTDQLKKAAETYKKAAQKNANDLTSPIYLFKAALAYEEVGKMEKAKDLFSKIKSDYPKSNEAQKIDKYIARVEAKI